MNENEVTENEPKGKKDLKLQDIFNTRGKRGAGYFVLTFLDFYVFSILFTGTMEYYMTDVSENVFSYVLSKHFLFYFYDIPRFIFFIPSPTSGDFYYAFSTVIFLIILLFVFFVFQRGYIAVLTGGTLGMLLCYASKIKFENRMELLNIRDLKLTEAAGMATNYLTLNFGVRFLGMLILVLLFAVLTFFTDRVVLSDRKQLTSKEKRYFWMIRIGLGLLMILSFFHYRSRIYNAVNEDDETRKLRMFPDMSSKYVVYRFFEDKSLAYDAEKARTTYEDISTQLIGKYNETENGSVLDPKDYPSIIVIMGESWWHMDRVDENKMILSPDPFEPIRLLGAGVSRGTAAVNIFGGGTISSELEFLTGWNAKYFNNSNTITTDMREGTIHSLVEYFNTLGYDTHGIHPFYESFYSRDELYKNMGFDHMTFDSDMQYRKGFDRYIGDDALADQIIYEYENRSAERAFIFSVSVAAHSPYLDYPQPLDKDYPYSVSLTTGKDWDPIDDWEDIEFYGFQRQISAIHETSEAYAKLVRYFEKKDEPVILVMFGDHCPNVSFPGLYDMGILRGPIDTTWRPFMAYPGLSNDTISDIQTLYSVPVVSWSNYLENADLNMDLNNLSVLGTRIIQLAGLPATKMTLLEDYYESQLSSDSLFYMLDAEQNVIADTTEEIDSGISVKTLIQYDQVYGDDVCSDLWKPLEREN